MKNFLTIILVTLGLCFYTGQQKQTTPKNTKAKTTVTTKTKTLSTSTTAKLKKDGTPDRRYKQNKKLKKDGTPDRRYKENK